MSNYIPVDTPGGAIWVEIEETGDSDRLALTGIRDEAVKSFQEVVEALKKNGRYILNTLSELGPDEVEVSFGIKVGVEGGNPFFCLAKASGEANYSVKITWKEEGIESDIKR